MKRKGHKDIEFVNYTVDRYKEKKAKQEGKRGRKGAANIWQ